MKTVCMLANIDNKIRGRKQNPDTNRKEFGMYKKYELITSHTARRSFATNLHSIVPNHVIMDIGGWQNEEMLLHYVKRTKNESAAALKELWTTNN